MCLLDIVPIKNEKREVVLFLASHKEIIPSRSKCLAIKSTTTTINIQNTLTVPGFETSSDDDWKEEGINHANGLLVNLNPFPCQRQAP